MIDVVVFAVVSVTVGLVSIHAKPAALRTAAFAVLIGSTIGLWYFSLGLPRPEYAHVPNGTVLSYSLDEPKAIYLWLMPDGSAEPLAFVLPWRNDVAGNLVHAAQSKATPSDSLRVRNQNGQKGLPVKPLFYVSHVHGLPPKGSAP